MIEDVLIVILVFAVIFVICKILLSPASTNTMRHAEPSATVEKAQASAQTKYRSMYDYLKQTTRAYPSKCALKVPSKSQVICITYEQLQSHVIKFAQLIAGWLGNKVNVGIVGKHSLITIYATLGAMLNGGTAHVITDTNTNANYMQTIRDHDIELLIVEGDAQLLELAGNEQVINVDPVRLIIYYTPITGDILDLYVDVVPLVSLGNAYEKKSDEMPQSHDISKSRTAVRVHKSGRVVASATNRELVRAIQSIKKSLPDTSCGGTMMSFVSRSTLFGQLIGIYLPIACAATMWVTSKHSLIETADPTFVFASVETWRTIHAMMPERCTTKLAIAKRSHSELPDDVILLNDMHVYKLF